MVSQVVPLPGDTPCNCTRVSNILEHRTYREGHILPFSSPGWERRGGLMRSI
jgi:hypothetical protein